MIKPPIVIAHDARQTLAGTISLLLSMTAVGLAHALLP
jgi:hypothetical protein